MSEALPEVDMSVDEALEFADEWSRGITLYAGSQGWRVVCLLLANEVRRLSKELADRNEDAQPKPLKHQERNDIKGLIPQEDSCGWF